MGADGTSAPAWLFSFVDLAFLLLIAMTQVGGDPVPEVVNLGEMVVPKIAEDSTASLPSSAPERWQLRVHPPAEGELPFELVGPEPAISVEAARLSADDLRVQLASLHAERSEKPLLAPHADSRSQDLLEAAGALEEHWPRRRRATVAPILPGLR